MCLCICTFTSYREMLVTPVIKSISALKKSQQKHFSKSEIELAGLLPGLDNLNVVQKILLVLILTVWLSNAL